MKCEYRPREEYNEQSAALLRKIKNLEGTESKNLVTLYQKNLVDLVYLLRSFELAFVHDDQSYYFSLIPGKEFYTYCNPSCPPTCGGREVEFFHDIVGSDYLDHIQKDIEKYEKQIDDLTNGTELADLKNQLSELSIAELEYIEEQYPFFLSQQEKHKNSLVACLSKHVIINNTKSARPVL